MLQIPNRGMRERNNQMDPKMEIRFAGGKKVYADYQGVTIQTDQSVKDGGDNTAPTPSDLFFASLATCSGLYALRFCESRKIDTADLKISMELQSHPKTGMVEKIVFKINLPPEFPGKYTSALIKSMNLCYVKKHFQQPPEFEFDLS
jgi:ribosomal protein S12 methylthiotransferase accessory factor